MIIKTLNQDRYKVRPIFRDKFYVYALCKPNGTPFYIGKGKNSRINDHFKPSNLVGNSSKIGTIKKYGNSVKREILAYFDTEKKAYEYEEWLISFYGIMCEGGVLTNYAKTRFEYSNDFKKNIAGFGHKSREKVYSDELIVKAYILYFTKQKSIKSVSISTGIPRGYLTYVLRGIKNKVLYEDFILSELIKVNRQYRGDNTRIPKHKLSKNQPKPPSVKSSMFLNKVKIVKELRSEGLSYSAIVKITGFPKTTVARLSNLDNK